MKKSKIFALVSALLLTSGALVGCGGNNGGGSDEEELTGTALEVSKASKMTLAELEAASKAEFEAQPNETFKVVGLTSLLKKAMGTFAKRYNWVHYGETGEGAHEDNVYLKNDYKDYSLLKALNTADESYFADYALVQDARSFSAYIEDGILHNFVPSDWQSLGLKEEDTLPLKGVHFNKLFYTNTNFQKVTGEKLYNIWQVAGKATDAHHLSKVSFQTPVTEQINMSFLVSCYAKDNQKRIEDAYEHFYGKKWSSDVYENAGDQWVDEFLDNISTWHSSDGTAMKQTQLKDDWAAGVVYYGAFAKMKDAVGKTYDVDLDMDGEVEDEINLELVCGKDTDKYTYTSEKGVNAMTTVKWDWEIDGFNGFFRCVGVFVCIFTTNEFEVDFVFNFAIHI